jgi:hypothetical protein
MSDSDRKDQEDLKRSSYVRAYSHAQLAKEWGISLASLDQLAVENGWDREHALYWKDQALEVLKKSCEEQNIGAVKELLKAVAGVRPVGRPPKEEVQRHIAIEARIAKEYQADADRLSDPNHLRLVKDH